jgi:hypothetical protein
MMDNSEPAGETDEANIDGGSRPQQAGEAGTTRFGMEDGDNTDVPATGGPSSDSAAGENA